MKEFIFRVLTSHRILVLVLTSVFDVVVLFGVDVPAELAEKVACLVTAVSAVYIGGKSFSDYGAAVTRPAGIDHKGRPVDLMATRVDV